jgi:hypothetical protein
MNPLKNERNQENRRKCEEIMKLDKGGQDGLTEL